MIELRNPGRLSPPLVVTRDQRDFAVEAFEECPR
jgi:4-aminobutyrate aminotransferase-like enzyme